MHRGRAGLQETGDFRYDCALPESGRASAPPFLFPSTEAPPP